MDTIIAKLKSSSGSYPEVVSICAPLLKRIKVIAREYRLLRTVTLAGKQPSSKMVHWTKPTTYPQALAIAKQMDVVLEETEAYEIWHIPSISEDEVKITMQALELIAREHHNIIAMIMASPLYRRGNNRHLLREEQALAYRVLNDEKIKLSDVYALASVSKVKDEVRKAMSDFAGFNISKLDMAGSIIYGEVFMMLDNGIFARPGLERQAMMSQYPYLCTAPQQMYSMLDRIEEVAGRKLAKREVAKIMREFTYVAHNFLDIYVADVSLIQKHIDTILKETASNRPRWRVVEKFGAYHLLDDARRMRGVRIRIGDARNIIGRNLRRSWCDGKSIYSLPSHIDVMKGGTAKIYGKQPECGELSTAPMSEVSKFIPGRDLFRSDILKMPLICPMSLLSHMSIDVGWVDDIIDDYTAGGFSEALTIYCHYRC